MDCQGKGTLGEAFNLNDPAPIVPAIWPRLDSLGAVPTVFQGHRVAEHFGDPAAERAALRQGVGVVDFSFTTILRAVGRDTADYLNRRLSQKTIDMAPGETRRAALLDATGRMTADMELYRISDAEFLIVAPPWQGERLARELAKFIFSEVCQIEDASACHWPYAVIGPRKGDVPTPEGALRFPSELALGGDLILALPGTDRGRWPAAGVEAFHHERIRLGAPWWGIEMTEDTVPLDVGLLSAIHTDKGCYPGQETIARTLNLGHPARRLVGLRVEGGAMPATPAALKTVDGADAGKLTSSTIAPGGGALWGLAVVKWVHREAGRNLLLDGRRAVVTPLPFQEDAK